MTLRRLPGERVLSVRDLEVRTPEGTLLAGPLSWDLAVGECLLLKGENGSGKTTLIKTVLGHLPAKNAILEWGADEDEIAFLPQLGNIRFFLPMTIADVLGIKSESEEQVARVTSLGLLSRESLDLAWNTASGGERQKTLITRAFLGTRREPRLLVMDEPYNHLDLDSREKLSRLIRARLEESRKPDPAHAPLAMILISHETNLEAFGPDKEIDLGKAIR
jgi:ATPase subunit of ABC transporter with duplicated ATPase domains